MMAGKKYLAILVCICLVVMFILNPLSQPAKAVVATSAVVISAVLAVMAACGIGLSVSGMTSTQISEWIDGKLQDWATSQSSSVENLIRASGIGATASGLFTIAYGAYNGIRDFVNWLTIDEQLDNNTTIPIYDVTGNFVEIQNTYFGNETITSQNIDQYGQLIYNRTYNYYLCYNGPPALLCAYVTNSNYIIIINRYGNGQFTHCLAYYESNQNITWPSITKSFNIDSNTGYGYYNLGSSVLSGTTLYVPSYNSLREALDELYNNGYQDGYSLNYDVGIVDVPSALTNQERMLIDTGALPGSTVEGIASQYMDSVLSNTATATQTSTQTADYANSVEIVNDTPISVDTDHHIFGFNLPNFNLNLRSIWHYVTEAINYASGFINWFRGMLISVPALAIPFWMAITITVVLGVYKRFIL